MSCKLAHNLLSNPANRRIIKETVQQKHNLTVGVGGNYHHHHHHHHHHHSTSMAPFTK